MHRDAFVLAQAGLLAGRTVTTHGEDQAKLAWPFPDLRVVSGQPRVEEDHIVTSGGIGAGIDMSLHPVLRVPPELAADTARHMEYRWEGNLA
ncbi:hypothetical protein [Deinococcus hopiensis]|uniref:hypothetical protein n=1 Tax=Deinococcus hopiensis TaxID=309885 RepID=UPI0009FBD0BB|nr:hypothetical protein [Deinococcus hopiensis]